MGFEPAGYFCRFFYKKIIAQNNQKVNPPNWFFSQKQKIDAQRAPKIYKIRKANSFTNTKNHLKYIIIITDGAGFVNRFRKKRVNEV